MSQHTPGPWKASTKADNTGRKVIHNANGLLVAIVQHDADARLIAKAPEMVEILADLTHITAEYIAYGEKMREFGRGFSSVGKLGHEDSHVLSQARALLREIEGS